MNQATNRLLCHAVFDPALHKIVKRSKASKHNFRHVLNPTSYTSSLHVLKNPTINKAPKLHIRHLKLVGNAQARCHELLAKSSVTGGAQGDGLAHSGNRHEATLRHRISLSSGFDGICWNTRLLGYTINERLGQEAFSADKMRLELYELKKRHPRCCEMVRLIGASLNSDLTTFTSIP